MLQVHVIRFPSDFATFYFLSGFEIFGSTARRLTGLDGIRDNLSALYACKRFIVRKVYDVR